jgi:2-iminobutanoate/2-iminopropanoate deaminase
VERGRLRARGTGGERDQGGDDRGRARGLAGAARVVYERPMSTREALHTDQAPQAIGPYAQAVRVRAPGELVFCSGQIALDPATGQMVVGGVEAETRQVLANVRAVLSAAGLGPEHVAKTTIVLVDMGDFQAVNALYAEVFGAAPPARSTVAVAALPRGARVEIEVLAVR